MFFDPICAPRGCVSQAAFFFDIAVVKCAVTASAINIWVVTLGTV